jgi:hypothetical protein
MRQRRPVLAAEHRWCSYDVASRLVTFRGLREGPASVREFVTERATALPELQLA